MGSISFVFDLLYYVLITLYEKYDYSTAHRLLWGEWISI